MNTYTLAPVALDSRYGCDEPDDVFPRTVRHFGGETVITEPPTRTIAISTGNLDGSVALGVIPAGSTHNDSGGFVPDYLRDTSLARPTDNNRSLNDLVDLGPRTAPSLDLINELRPTLITASFRGYGSRAYAELTACGPTILPEGKGFNWKTDLLLLSSALGRTARAQTLLTDYATRASAVAAQYRAAGSPILSVARYGPAGLETHGTWSFCGSVLSDIGARRPPEQSRHDNGTRLDAGTEATTLDADIMLFTRVTVPAAETAWREAMPAWASLPAVADGRAHEVDAACWHGHAGILAAFTVLDQIEEALTAHPDASSAGRQQPWRTQ